MGRLPCTKPTHSSWRVPASFALNVMSVGAVFLLCGHPMGINASSLMSSELADTRSNPQKRTSFFIWQRSTKVLEP